MNRRVLGLCLSACFLLGISVSAESQNPPLTVSGPGASGSIDLPDDDGAGVVNLLDLGLLKAGFFAPLGPTALPNPCASVH